MGLALMALIWLITLVSTYFFVAKTWWLPVGASAAAGWIDHQFALTFVIMGIVFLAAQLSLGYIVWRYRESPSSPPVEYSHGNNTLEVTWTVLTTILFIGLNLMGSSVWASQRFDPPEPGAVQVEVTGMQFAWYFRYPGPDGKYGTTSPKLMDPSAGGEAAVGLSNTDPAAKDDVVTGTMYLPVNREVDLSLRAVDVIHSFFVPQSALQAGRGSGAEDPHALQADGDWRVRDCLRRTVRAWALQDARHGPRRQPGGFRQVAGGTGGGETIKWRPRLRFTRTLLRASSGNTFSASITKSSAFSITFWRSRRCLSGCFCRC